MRKSLRDSIPEEFQEHLPYVRSLMTTASDGPLEALENAIHVAKLERMANWLTARGFHVMHRRAFDDHELQFNLILVCDPTGNLPGEWATLDECRRLLDTVANLSPAEAFARWRTKVEPLEPISYTSADAVRDTRAAREALRQRASETHMSAQDYALECSMTSFMDLAPKK